MKIGYVARTRFLKFLVNEKKKKNEMVKVAIENEQGRKCLVFATRRRLMLMKKKEKKRKISMCKNMT